MLRQTRHRLGDVFSTLVEDFWLQLILWTFWTCAVVATGYLNWHADHVAQRPINLVGLIIHCTLVGVISLVVLTKIEMWVQPWKFMS